MACDLSFYTAEAPLVCAPAAFREDRKAPVKAIKPTKHTSTAGADLAGAWRSA